MRLSTPEERLRKKREELVSEMNRQEKERENGRQQQVESLATRKQLASLLQEQYSKRAAELRDAGGFSIHAATEPLGDGEGFRIRMGRLYSLEAMRGEDSWVVKVTNAEGVSEVEYDDEEFVKAVDELLEPLVEDAMEALAADKDTPGGDPYRRG